MSAAFIWQENLNELSAVNWLHVHGDLDSEQGREIKSLMREYFYSDTPEWKQLIWDRALWSFNKMAEGLRQLD